VRAAVFGLLVLVGACAAHPVCPEYAPSAIARPFLWRVSGPDGSMVIQATHQGTGDGDVSRAALLALDASELYVTEANEAAGHAPANPGDPMPRFWLPSGTSLERMLSDDDFRTLREYVEISPTELSRLKPWVAFMLLGRSRYEFPERSINTALLERARSQHLAVQFLETWDEQIEYLDAAITPRKLTLAIRDADNLPCHLAKRLAAFRAGDDAAFANDVVPGEPVIPRIERWYGALREILASGRHAFVAVGIGQIVGPHGLLQRFATDGYRVQRE
jgi:uncharacterized protein YbaP (TraB family)